MKKSRFAIVGASILALATLLFIQYRVTLFDWIADTLLANEVSFDDREPPPTPYAMTASSDRIQLAGGQGNGLSCSLPFGAQTLGFVRNEKQAPIALQMRQVCAFHDYCYRHGNATYGYSQADCDYLLQQQAFRLCKFINAHATISECETNARKVTLGVRLGGSGNFKRARALDDDEASTYLEFDPYPVRASVYRTVRIADAPRQWVRDGLLPKAIYHFDIKPSGSLVHVLGWKATGDMACSSFELPASYNAINGPPMVVRDAINGEDWFIWWKRRAMEHTEGHFALLPPGRATPQDWAQAAGGYIQRAKPGLCGSKEFRSASEAATNDGKQIAIITKTLNPRFSELHPVKGGNTPGKVRLMALSTHSCHETDRSLCLVNIEFDTSTPKIPDPARVGLYRAIDRNCSSEPPDGRPRDSCDRYRDLVGAPFVVAHEDRSSLIWLRRGAGNGDGYETSAKVQRYAIGKTRQEPGINLGEMALTALSESMEPAFITNAASANPIFVSLVADGDKFKILAQTAAPKGESSAPVELECFRNAEASWLRRSAALVQDPTNPARSFIVLTRVHFPEVKRKTYVPTATLEVAIIALVNGSCLSVQQAAFPAFYKDFANTAELSAAEAASKNPCDTHIDAAKVAFGSFAERVRGGQLVLADVTGDGVPDLVQIAQMPRPPDFRSALLVGSLDDTGLRFREVAAPLRKARDDADRRS